MLLWKLPHTVEFEDKGIIAQLGTPDMRLPIQYALFYPHRRPLNSKALDLFELGQMTFEAPDFENFKGLRLAYQAARTGGSMPTVFNAANERAVAMFLNRKIGFLEIADVIEEAMSAHKNIENPSLEDILKTEAATYEWIESR